MASVKIPVSFPSIDFTKLDLPKFDMPKFEIPKMNLLKVELPTVELPTIELPVVDTEAVTGAIKDAGYITVGLAVLAVQKVQVRRQELRKSLKDQAGRARSPLSDVVAAVESGVAGLDAQLVKLESSIDDAVESIERRLPATAGAIVGQAHGAVKVVRQQVRSMVQLTD